jgi:hypothetical protein
MKRHPLVTILCQLHEVARLLGANFNIYFFPTASSQSLVLLDNYINTILVLWLHVAEIVLTHLVPSHFNDPLKLIFSVHVMEWSQDLYTRWKGAQKSYDLHLAP